MGLRHPERTRGSRRNLVRTLPLAGFVVLALALSGCSDDTQLERAGMPKIVTAQGQGILDLWQGAWIAALATGAVVWGLILFAVIYYRRRSDDEIPIQTRYNLPVEIFYTIFPIVMVIVFFSHTVRVQNEVMHLDPTPDVRITVVGQKWQWTFNHHLDPSQTDGKVVYVAGDLNNDSIPTLVLPVDETIEFDLESADVIHDFGVPAFAMRMDVVPGRDNKFQVTPTEIGGPYAGKCYELCGTYHSRMLFQVKVVSQDDYQSYIQRLEAVPDHSADHPVIGGSYTRVPYLNPEDETEGEQK